MNTATYHAGRMSTAPTPYMANVLRASRALLKALFAVPPVRPAAVVHDRSELLRVARSYRDTAPSLSQELAAIACRDY